jgi:hypothetical protein
VQVAECTELSGLTTDGTTVFWADAVAGSIAAQPVAGGETKTLATERDIPMQLTADAAALFWVELPSETVFRLDKSGGTPQRITRDVGGFESLTLDASFVYWRSEAAHEGTFRMPDVGAVASDGAHVFFTQNGEIWSLDGRADADAGATPKKLAK